MARPHQNSHPTSNPTVDLGLDPNITALHGGVGLMHQSNAAAAAEALYNHHAGRWLQSAGLQHLASPLAYADQRLRPSLLMQGYGAQSAEDKQKVFKLLRNLNFNGESGSEPYTPTSQSFGASGVAYGFYFA